MGTGILVSLIGAAGHPGVYAVLVASGSAAVVLPIVHERRLAGQALLTLIAQVTVADIAATIAIPFVLRPGKRARPPPAPSSCCAIHARPKMTINATRRSIATGASLLIAGFGAGLMVAAIGGPKRLSTEVLGVAGGFFVPLFFVLLGARIDLRGVVEHPAVLGLALALASLTVIVHVLAAFITHQPSVCSPARSSASRPRSSRWDSPRT